MNPPIPIKPCSVCGKPTSAIQFVLGNACCKAHFDQVKPEIVSKH